MTHFLCRVISQTADFTLLMLVQSLPCLQQKWCGVNDGLGQKCEGMVVWSEVRTLTSIFTLPEKSDTRLGESPAQCHITNCVSTFAWS